MRRLINKHEMPPTGFFYVDPDTQYMSNGPTLDMAIQLAKRHRTANNLDVPDKFAEIVEDFICVNNDPDFSIGDTDRKFNVPLTETWIRSSSQEQLQAWRKNDREFVSQSEADRRAAICVSCQYNIHTPVCFSCVGLDLMFDSYFKRSTTSGTRLKVCKLCAVPNGSQVHIPGDALIDRKVEFPEKCWYKKELERRSA